MGRGRIPFITYLLQDWLESNLAIAHYVLAASTACTAHVLFSREFVVDMSAKRKILTFEEKTKIIEEFKKCDLSKAAFAVKKGTARTTLNDILASEEAVEESHNKKRKRHHASCFEDIEQALLIWLKFARSQNVPVSSLILKEKALEIAAEMGHTEFSASNGWMDRFKSRHNLCFKKMNGESASVDPETSEKWRTEALKLDLCKNYEPGEIFNLDECGLFYRMVPDRTLSFKDEKCYGGKKSKERLTVLLGIWMVARNLHLWLSENSKVLPVFKM